MGQLDGAGLGMLLFVCGFGSDSFIRGGFT